MNFVSQVHDTGDNNSINICKICFLREWYAYGRTMGKKGCLHLLLGTHPRLASFVYVPVLLSCDFHVSKTCHFCLLKLLCCIWYSRVAHRHSHTLLQLRYIHFLFDEALYQVSGHSPDATIGLHIHKHNYIILSK